MIHIWIRRTVDWADEQAVLAQVPPPFRPALELWNATFNISYPRFRHRVAQIAQLNHSRVAGARVSDWHEIPDGALVLPVDDDDWFAPGAARAVQTEIDPEALVYHWTSRWIEVPIDLRHRLYLLRRRLFPRTPPMWLCSTNNYAMVKTADSKEPLGSHVKASRAFEGPAQRGDASVKRIDGQLSVANRTLASQTTLIQRHVIGRARLIRKHRRHRRLYDRPLAPDLEWCRPYVAMMSELMGELEVRR